MLHKRKEVLFQLGVRSWELDNLRKWGGVVLESDTECSETDTLFVFVVLDYQ